jgi:hypothetical protein
VIGAAAGLQAASGRPAFARTVATGGVMWVAAGALALAVAASFTARPRGTLGAGEAAPVVAAALAALVGFALVGVRARRLADMPAALAAVAVAVLCSADLLHAGSGIANLAFAAGLLLALEVATPAGAIVATLLAVAWCNVAPQGLLAALFAGAWALGRSFERPRDGSARIAWTAAFGCVLATLATPAGLAFPAVACEALHVDRGLVGLVPMHPFEVAPLAYRAGFMLVVLGALGLGARFRTADVPVLAVAFLLSLANGVYLPLLGAVAGPALGSAARGTILRVVAAALAFAVAALVMGGAAQAGRTNAHEPYELVGRLRADGAPHRLFCSSLAWCSAASAAGLLRLHVYLDERVELYPAPMRDVQRTIARARPGWRAELAHAGIDTIVVGRREALAALLALDPRWRQSDADGRAIVFVRATGVPR